MYNYVMNKLPESFGSMFTFNYEIQESSPIIEGPK